jgi:hypothetical protein
MSLSSKLETLSHCFRNILRYPYESARLLAYPPPHFAVRGSIMARQWGTRTNGRVLESGAALGHEEDNTNPLEAYFDGIKEGAGVLKWRHYFEPYHRHLRKFIGRKVTVVEVGVYSGGSMPMWRQYFGEGCHVHGIDIKEECKAHENSHTTIHVGDQGSRGFWQRFREEVPSVDVLIDDGSHLAEHQIVTLEEILQHLRPGGVYICEDVHGIGNPFAAYAHSLADELNATVAWDYQDHGISCTPTPFQTVVHSVHLYPFVVVIEKRESPLKAFSCPKHGTKWIPW